VFQGRIKHKQVSCAGLGCNSPERLRSVSENEQEAFARLLCPAVSVREERWQTKQEALVGVIKTLLG